MNGMILKMYRDRNYSYLAADKMAENFEKGPIRNTGCPTECLNAMKPPGFPPLKSDPKVECAAMILQNVASTNRMCNETRIRVQ